VELLRVLDGPAVDSRFLGNDEVGGLVIFWCQDLIKEPLNDGQELISYDLPDLSYAFGAKVGERVVEITGLGAGFCDAEMEFGSTRLLEEGGVFGSYTTAGKDLDGIVLYKVLN